VDDSLCEWGEYLEKEATPDGLVSAWEDSMRVFGITHIHTHILQRRRNLMGLASNFYFLLFFFLRFLYSLGGVARDHACYILFLFLGGLPLNYGA